MTNSSDLASKGEYRRVLTARFILAGFLAFTAIAARLLHSLVLLWPPLVVCAAVGAYNGVLLFTRWIHRKPGLVTFVSLHLDMVALTMYLHYTGDIENPLMYAYSLPVGLGAILLSRRAGFLLAATGSILFFLLLYATCFDASPVPLNHHHLDLMNHGCLTRLADPDDYGPRYIVTHVLILAALLLGSAFVCERLAKRPRILPAMVQGTATE